jgi:hypothetical protein
MALPLPTPKVVEPFPGIVQMIAAQRSAHAYVVRGSRRTVLNDSGLPATYDYLLASLAALQLTPDDIDEGIRKLKSLMEGARDIFSVLRETGCGHDDILWSLRDLNAP